MYTLGEFFLETFMSETPETPRRRTGWLIWLLGSQLLALGSLLIRALMAGLSVMAFDEGVSTEARTIVITVWSHPVFPLVMVIAAWIAFARRRNMLAAVLSGLSFAPPVLLSIFLWVAI
jgi:hypothetical protein